MTWQFIWTIGVPVLGGNLLGLFIYEGFKEWRRRRRVRANLNAYLEACK